MTGTPAARPDGPVRFAVVGCGVIGRKHAQTIRRTPGAELTAVVDCVPATAKDLAEEYGVPPVLSVEEVLDRDDVDAVAICTPSGDHAAPAILAVRAGKHVVVEKPVDVTVGAADALNAAVTESGCTATVISQHRFDPSSVAVEAAARAGRFGRLTSGVASVAWWRSESYYGSGDWRGTWALDGGGALMNQAIHQVDILRWLAGPVAELFAYWQLGALHKIESEDVVNAVVRYASGATGVIQASTAFWPGYTERTEFHGTKGTAIISGDKLTSWDVENDSGPPAPVEKEVASGASDPMAISLEPFERQFLDFGAAIREKRKPLVAGEEGLAAIEIVDAVYRSCRSGGKVAL
jgi:predicted dehydrogenase